MWPSYDSWSAPTTPTDSLIRVVEDNVASRQSFDVILCDLIDPVGTEIDSMSDSRESPRSIRTHPVPDGGCLDHGSANRNSWIASATLAWNSRFMTFEGFPVETELYDRPEEG